MNDTITAFLRGVINKLPHRPSSDDESRLLFKRIVSSMSKGDVRKHIIKDLEKYFGVFEEYLVEKESTLIKQLIGGERKDKKVLEKQNVYVKNIQSKATKFRTNYTKKSTVTMDLFKSIIFCDMNVEECIKIICVDSFGAINNGINTYKFNKLLLESAFSKVVLGLSCNNHLDLASIACMFSYFYVVLPTKRQQICNLLMVQGIDGSSSPKADSLRLVALTLNFLGFIGYWVTISVRGACNDTDTVGWSIDDGKSDAGLVVFDLDCQHLVSVLKDVSLHHMNNCSTTLEYLLDNCVECGVVPSGSISFVSHIALITACVVQQGNGNYESLSGSDKQFYALLVNMMMNANRKGESTMAASIVWTTMKADILASNDSSAVELDESVGSSDSKHIVELVSAVWADEAVMQKIVVMMRESVAVAPTQPEARTNQIGGVFDDFSRELANEDGMSAAAMVDMPDQSEEDRQSMLDSKSNSSLLNTAISTIPDKSDKEVASEVDESDHEFTMSIGYEVDTTLRRSTRSSSISSTTSTGGSRKKSKSVLESYRESVEQEEAEAEAVTEDPSSKSTPKMRSKSSSDTPRKRARSTK